MKVSYYPGCSLEGTAREYSDSTEAVAKRLGVSLHELTDWNCCGAASASEISEELAVGLSARNLRIASQAGLDLVVPCAACFSKLKHAEKKLASGARVEGMPADYRPPRVRYAVDFFWNDVGEKPIAAAVKKPLSGLNLVCYYGCLSSRPPAVTDSKSPEDPTEMDRLMETLGANVKNWSYKTQCCGGALAFTRQEIAMKMAGKLKAGALEAGADCIVSGCPLCQASLDMNMKEVEGGGLPVFYFTELMSLAFGDGNVDRWLRRHLVDGRPLLKGKGLLI